MEGNMKKKMVSVLLCGAMAMTMFAGCGMKSTSGGKATASKSSGGDGGKVYYLNFKPEAEDAWQDLAKKYTEETGTEVKVVTAASGTYEQQLTSEMAKSDAPTLFQVNGPVGLNNWRDYCDDMSSSELYQHMKEGTDSFTLQDGDKVLGIAYAIETYGIIYNKTLFDKYTKTEGAVVKSADEITSFDTLKKVADDIQSKKSDLGIDGAFSVAGMDGSSDWRFKTHLANLPIYYEYQKEGETSTEAIKGEYLDQYKQIWDLYITDSTCDPKLLSSKTIDDANGEFSTGKAVFYQNGTWAVGDVAGDGKLKEEELGMLPIFIGGEGEENQGLCTGSENYWCVNTKASDADKKATYDFLNWVVTSDAGRDALANTMGFVTPFDTFTGDYETKNPLVKIANEYVANGKTPVSWNFATIPSEEWKNNLGSALTAYAAGTGDWDAVTKAFVDGWASEYAATHE
jgi:raffinose/stachyose/melibiose transport system substrate-binding protein